MKLHHAEEFRPLFPRFTPHGATRCFGGGGGSADQTQTQTQTTTNTQYGAGDGSIGNAQGEGNTVTTNIAVEDVSAEAIAAGLAAAQNIAQNAGDAAYWTAADAQTTAQQVAAGAQETAQHGMDVGYWVAADAQTTAQEVAAGAQATAQHGMDVGYWTAVAGLETGRDMAQGANELAYQVNKDNTSLLATLGRLFTQGAGDMVSGALGFGSDAIRGAYNLASDTTETLAANYRFNADRQAAMYEKSLGDVADLAKSTSTGGQSDVNKSYVWIVGIVAAVFILPSIFGSSRK